MSKIKTKPFETFVAEARYNHKHYYKTLMFGMMGLCLVAVEKSSFRVYSEAETLEMFGIIKARLKQYEAATAVTPTGKSEP